jgi:hypothetical protein
LREKTLAKNECQIKKCKNAFVIYLKTSTGQFKIQKYLDLFILAFQKGRNCLKNKMNGIRNIFTFSSTKTDFSVSKRKVQQKVFSFISWQKAFLSYTNFIKFSRMKIIHLYVLLEGNLAQLLKISQMSNTIYKILFANSSQLFTKQNLIYTILFLKK